MAARKQFLGVDVADTSITDLMKTRRERPTTDEELREQRISYAFGNALTTEGITKDSVRAASNSFRLRG